MQKIVDNNELLIGKKFKLITAGFTNTIYSVDDYIIRICTDSDNEERFATEISFYKENKENDGIPKLYASDISKSVVPYYYEIIEKVSGKTLYELWYKLSDVERQKIVIKMIDILRPLHSKVVKGYEFLEMLKTKVLYLRDKCNFDEEMFNDLINMCYKYFKDNTFGLIHGDLHFNNILVNDNNEISLIDFEKIKRSFVERELDPINRMSRNPNSFNTNSEIILNDYDFQNIMNFIKNNFEEINNDKFDDRLLLFDCLNSLMWLDKYPKYELYNDILFNKSRKLLR